MEVSIERSDCISCGLCVSTCPDVFRIAEDGLAEVYRQPGPAHLPAVKSFVCHASHPPPRRTAHRSAKNTLRLRRNFHKEVDTR